MRERSNSAKAPMAENMRLATGESSPVKTSRSSTNSITDRAAFRAEIEKVRRQGYAVTDEENENGMRAVAVPLLNSQGHAFASLATAVPVFRLSIEAFSLLVP